MIALVAACSVATHHRRTHAAAQDQGYVAVIWPSLGGVLGGSDRRVERAEAGGDRRLAFIADINLARRILADQNGAKSGCDSSLRFQLYGRRSDIGNKAIRARFSIDPFRHPYCVVDLGFLMAATC